MFRTGPIYSAKTGEVRILARVLAAESPIAVAHAVAFSVVQLGREPVVIHAEERTIQTGALGQFETKLPSDVRDWEVRIDADPDLAYITVYHLLDGEPEPSMTYRTGDLYYVDLFDEIDGSDGGFLFPDDDFFSDNGDHWFQLGDE